MYLEDIMRLANITDTVGTGKLVKVLIWKKMKEFGDGGIKMIFNNRNSSYI